MKNTLAVKMSKFITTYVSNDYSLLIYGIESTDQITGNIDCELQIESARYAVTFFTPQSISELLQKSHQTGEWGHGSYFWASDMVIIESITEESLVSAVDAIIAEGMVDRIMTKMT